ncbi:7986_t:CDS:1 [Paraglomus brasilianum]|uniref:7986_t:CDS:1 n=1 Tax=Paraglomus brasilianum TaxID=144538 RepID=A0A9N8Z670_9GLOM|nr:7986_t:CDS:1 [Paraglomus brasilianum]
MPFLLPTECLTCIFAELETNKSSIYSCIRVSREWCIAATPFLWKNPFCLTSKDRSAPSTIKKNMPIDAYLPFLSESAKARLRLNNVPTGLESSILPIFNYASYLRVLDMDEFYDEITKWIANKRLAQATQFDTTDNISYTISQQAAPEDGFIDYLSDIDDDDDEIQKILIAQELLFLFSDSSPKLYRLSIDTRRLGKIWCDMVVGILSLEISTSATNTHHPVPIPSCFSHIEQFEFKGEGDETDYEFEDMLVAISQFSPNVKILKIASCSQYLLQPLVDLIGSQQGINELVLNNIRIVGTSIFEAIAHHKKTLTHAEFHRCTFIDCTPMTALANCTRLENLIFARSGVTGELLAPLGSPSSSITRLSRLVLLDIYPSNGDSAEWINLAQQVNAILRRTGKTIRELRTNVHLTYFLDFVDTIISECPNLVIIEMDIQNIAQIPGIVTLLRSCKHLQTFRASIDGYTHSNDSVADDLIHEFAQIILPPLRRLEVRKWKISKQGLLFKCLISMKAPVRYVS